MSLLISMLQGKNYLTQRSFALSSSSSASFSRILAPWSGGSAVPSGGILTTTMTTMTTMSSRRYMGHTVRIIATKDLPHGKAYQGDVLPVKAGYARNYLIPQKMAVYATRHNFQKWQVVDPALTGASATATTTTATMGGKTVEDQYVKAADVLRYYLRNKVLKIWRNVDPVTQVLTPGVVNAKNIRQKLSKQLKIDLESPYEKVHLRAEPLLPDASTPAHIERIMLPTDQGGEMVDPAVPCQTEIKHLGEYLARITLRGGHMVPLRVEVLKR